MITREDFINISHKYGLKVFEDVKSHMLNVYYSQFKYIDNGYQFNLARLEIERNRCIAWEYRMYGNTLVHVNLGMGKMNVETNGELEELYGRFVAFVKNAEKEARKKRIEVL